MTVEEEFERWWSEEGSGMYPLPNEDQEEHARRVSRIAWLNGHYKASCAGVSL